MSMVCNASSGGSHSNKFRDLSSRSSSEKSDWEEELKMEKESREKKKIQKTFTFFTKVDTLPDYTKAIEIHKDIQRKRSIRFYERQAANIRAEKHSKERQRDAINWGTTTSSFDNMNTVGRIIPYELRGVRVVHDFYKNQSSTYTNS